MTTETEVDVPSKDPETKEDQVEATGEGSSETAAMESSSSAAAAVPKNDADGAAGDAGNKSKEEHPSPATTAAQEEPAPKRQKGVAKHEWMVFKGTKHSRVGTDFQVANLPSPSDFKNKENESKRADPNPNKGEK